MSASAVLVAGFPHGTPEGHKRGCRGQLCPFYRHESLMSCTEANVRYQGDCAYRRAVDAGTATGEKEQFADGVKTARTKTGEVLVKKEVTVLPTPTYERPEKQERPVAEKKTKEKPVATKEHGTYKGYGQGCRLRELCPNKLAGGISCTEAASIYQRERKHERRAAEGRPVTPRKTAVAPKAETAREVPVRAAVEVDSEAGQVLAELSQLREQHRRDEETIAALRAELAARPTDLLAVSGEWAALLPGGGRVLVRIEAGQ